MSGETILITGASGFIGRRLRDALSRAGEAFYSALDGVTLESLTCDNFDLQRILAPVSCPGPTVAAHA